MKEQRFVAKKREWRRIVSVASLVFSGVMAIATASTVAGNGGASGVVARLPAFSVGADVSDYGYIERHGGVYRVGGERRSLLGIFKRAGCNSLRLRLWHTASAAERKEWGRYDTLNTIEYTVRLARRIRRDGFDFVLDMHLSDTWADPQRQRTPYDWKGLGYRQLRRRVFSYARHVLTRFRAAHAMPAIVMVGNEINHGILWPVGRLKRHDAASWKRFSGLLTAAIAGVDAGSGTLKPQIMLQVGNFDDPKPLVGFFAKLAAHGVRFNVIGYDYYPYWGGATRNLRRNLMALATRIGKPVIVAETAYPWANDVYNESWAGKSGMAYGFSPQGQSAYIAHVISIVKALPRHLGRGVWWWGAEFTADQRMFARNPWAYRSLFDQNGEALPAVNTLCSAAVP
jgi:arabinogalactan endo-1,4-beta-galactosidase